MELLLEKISAILQGSSPMPILKLGAEGHICRYIAIVTDFAICSCVNVCSAYSAQDQKELSANDGPKFTRKDWEHMQQPVLLQHFQEFFQHITQQLPYTALEMSKGISHVLNCLPLSPISISRQISSDLFFSGSRTGGISPVLLSPVPFFLIAV